MNELYKPNKKVNIASRLQKLATSWQRKYEAPLKHTQMLLKLYASGFYDMGVIGEHLINLVGRGVSTIQPYLVEGDPRVMVTSKVTKFKPYAYSTQLALNFLISKMKLAENVFIPIAINSLFGAGITRMMFDYNRKISLDDEEIKIGTPWISVIDPSNYIGDPSAKRRSDFAFEGDIYRLPTKFARDLFAGKDKNGNQIADYIGPDCKLVSKYGPEEISDKNFCFDRLALRDYTTFIDFYLYDSNEIITIMPEGQKAKILKSVEWEGPGDGPYDYLGYNYFPECPIPIPPAYFWNDLDVSLNIVAKAAREQAESQKDLLVVPPNQEEEGKKVLSAKNMDIIVANDPSLVSKVSLGGTNEVNYNWMAWAENQFTKSATAVPDIIGGRGAQAPTLGQEQMTFSNATRALGNMYSRFSSFMASTLEKLAWGVWSQPDVYMEFVETIPGVGEVPIIFSQADQVGDFYDFTFDVEPYSSQRTTPEVKYSRLMQYLTTWILPTMQIAAQQGAQLDIPEVSKILAGYLDISTINQWYKTVVPDPPNDKENPWMALADNKFKQGNDKFGATTGSREANKNANQERTTGSVGGTNFVGPGA